MNLRIGNGYDVHAFDTVDSSTVGNDSIGDVTYITLGGVEIPHKYSLIAHSDGDVLIHALCDALLGALALGDIGHHFPDTHAEFKGIDSKILLKKVVALIKNEGYQLNNCDCTIVAQTPKMAPYIVKMRETLAVLLNVSVNTVSVKATTTEKLGFTGRGEGIAAYAVVLIQSLDNNV